MRRFSALFLCLSLSILLTARTSSIETYSPGYTGSIETITDQYPIFTFGFADSAILCLTYGNNMLNDNAVYTEAPIATMPLILSDHIQMHSIEIESGHIYAWYIYDYKSNVYSSVRYFRSGMGNIMGEMLLKSLLDMFLADNEQYKDIIDFGYKPTGKIIINNNESEINILRFYLEQADPKCIRVRIREYE